VAKLAKKTILVVDDDDAARAILRDMLTDAGYDVVEAADGVIALGIMEKRTVDLMITDRSMPGLGGLELMGKLKEKKKLVPTLMVSAYGEESFWGTAIGLGAVDYLLKPFKAEDVLKIVEKSLQGKSKS
jgi:DNA-binding response OmpR family regulator